MSDRGNTKQALAAGLKTLCRTKNFDKISIADITKHCGLNRQTFYYHFKDKYDLLNWIYDQEGFRQLVGGITLKNWDHHLEALLETMIQEKVFYSNTIRYQPEHFVRSLFEITKTLFLEAIAALDESSKLSPENKTFYANFYACGCCGIAVQWVESGMISTPAEVATQLKRLAKDSESLAWRLYQAEKEISSDRA